MRINEDRGESEFVRVVKAILGACGTGLKHACGKIIEKTRTIVGS